MSHPWKYTQKQYSKDLLVRHMASNHHPDNLYRNIQEDFITKIEIQNNPSGDYYSKMKGLYMDQLDSGVKEHNEKKIRYRTDMEEIRKNYNENVNGVIAYLEKEQLKRDEFIKKCLAQQEKRMKAYVDINGSKIQKADRLIAQNCENQTQLAKSYYFQKQNLKLPQINARLQNRKSENVSYHRPNETQTPYRISLPKNREQIPKQNFTTDRYLHLRTRTDQNLGGISQNPDKFHSKLKLGEQNHKKIFKLHNPITNPIEYHVENPYFLKKMQEKYQNL